MKRWFRRAVLRHRWRTFAVLGLSFAAFGGGTVNLFTILRANLALIGEHGWLALADGAALQFLELAGTLYLCMGAWVVFKSCEAALVHAITEPHPKDEP